MVDKTSPFIEDYFGDLFVDWPVSNVGNNCMAYYKVNYENDWYSFSLVKGGSVE